MFGFKEPTRAIPVIDDASTLVVAKSEALRQQLEGADLFAEARAMLAERLKPEVSGLNAQALELGGPEARLQVEVLAWAVLDQLRERGLAGRGPLISDSDYDALVMQLLDWQFGAGAIGAAVS